MRALLAGALAAVVVLLPGAARAEDSAQGPFYLQGGLGVSYWDFPHIQTALYTTSYSWTGFNPLIEAGYHFSGRHDGFTLGIRQAFSIDAIQGSAAGTTVARGGYDLAFKVSSVEINVDPFATFGVGYIFDGLVPLRGGPSAGINATGGLDVKVFFAKGFYALARPGELGFQCFHDYGICAFSYAMSVGAGYAFGGR